MARVLRIKTDKVCGRCNGNHFDIVMTLRIMGRNMHFLRCIQCSNEYATFLELTWD